MIILKECLSATNYDCLYYQKYSISILSMIKPVITEPFQCDKWSIPSWQKLDDSFKIK